MVDTTEGLSYDIGNGYHAIDAEAARNRLDGYAVVSGLTPTPGTGLSVSISSGEAIVGTDGSGNTVSVTLGSSTEVSLDAADSTNPRKDVVWIDDTATVGSTTGTADPGIDGSGDSATRFNTVQPEPPIPSGDKTILAEVWVPANATGLASADVRDRRQPAQLVGESAQISTVEGAASGTTYVDDSTQTVGDGTTAANHESVNTNQVVGNQRLHAVHQANRIRENAGVPDNVPVGVRSDVTPGVSGTLTDTNRITIGSESDASAEADSGSGTESDPYVIQDRNLDNSEGSTNSAGFLWTDTDADYYIRLQNCEITGYDADQIQVDIPIDGAGLEVSNCTLYSSVYLIDVRGGFVTVTATEFAGSSGFAGIEIQGESKVTIRDSIWDDSQITWGSSVSGISPTGDIDATVDVRYCEFSGSMDSAVDVGEIEEIKFKNSLVTAPVGKAFANGSGYTGEISDLIIDSVSDNALNLGGPVDFEVARCEIIDPGGRGIHLNSVGGSVDNAADNVEIHHIKFTQTGGSNAPGWEAIEPRTGAKNVEVHHCWVTECPEDAYEAAQTVGGCSFHHLVADNCTGQIVDIFKAVDPTTDNTVTGRDVGGEVHHIYGDTQDTAVQITDANGVAVSDIYARCGNGGVTLEQRDGTAGETPDNCSIDGPLPLSSVVGLEGPFTTEGSVGPNNRVFYYQDGLQEPSSEPRQTEVR